MPTKRDIKTITGVMYPLQIIEARQIISSYQTPKTRDFVSWGGTLVSFLSKSFSIAGTAASLLFGITDHYSSVYLETQEDLYTLLHEEVTLDNLVYVEVKQNINIL